MLIMVRVILGEESVSTASRPAFWRIVVIIIFLNNMAFLTTTTTSGLTTPLTTIALSHDDLIGNRLQALTCYVSLSGSGSPTYFQVIKDFTGLPVYGPKQQRTIEMTFEERYRHYLRNKYSDNFIAFVMKFDFFIYNYKKNRIMYDSRNKTWVELPVEFYRELFAEFKVNYLRSLERKRVKCDSTRIIYPNNRYCVLDLDPFPKHDVLDWCEEAYSYHENKCLSQSKREKNKKEREYRKLKRQAYQNIARMTRRVVYRNLVLLDSLREILFRFALARKTKNAKPHFLSEYLERLNFRLARSINNVAEKYHDTPRYILEAQMEDPRDGDNEQITTQSSGNTLSISQRPASEGIAGSITNLVRLNNLTAAENIVDCDNLTNRFFPHGTFQWSSNQNINTMIMARTLPLDFIVNHPNSANCTLFNNYAYWSGDIEVKIMLNANKFQIGQLQMAWYYGQDYEANFNRRDNVYSASQQIHCLVSASSSNEGIIYIPFKYYKPKMGTKKRIDDPGRLNMGKLTIRVLNPLSVSNTVFNTCNFTLSFRFVNSSFSGMLARDFGSVGLESQMFSLVKGAMKLLNETMADPQRDNPPDITPALPLVPWSAHSWSIGDILSEPTNSLRLQASGQTPHLSELLADYDEMKISSIVRVFGLLKIIKWGSSLREGNLLFSLNGSPIVENNMLYSTNYEDSICYGMPPVSVLSNLFSYWRGSLRLRIDFISSLFHSGRLLIGYVPRVLETPTLEQLKSCPYEIFDLQGESRQLVFDIPYIADRPWWPTGGFEKRITAPSHVYCFVLNPLIPMNEVANEISLNLYLSGAEDFELSVPISPRIGLSTYNALVYRSADNIAQTRVGYTPIYTSWWKQFDSNLNMLRYGNVTDHVVQFDNLKRGYVYKHSVSKNGKTLLNNTRTTSEWWIVGIPIDVKGNYCPYAAYFPRLDRAFAYADSFDKRYCDKYAQDSDWFIWQEDKQQAKGVIYFEVVDRPTPPPVTTSSNAMSFNTITYTAQMNERENHVAQSGLLPALPSTSAGLLTFGEKFDDLKVLCRRYQMYASYNKDHELDVMLHKQEICLPILPQRIVYGDEDLMADPMLNIMREGVIPIIASGFRFYRGGVRFRFVWRSSFDCLIRLEHRPDEKLSGVNVEIKGHKSVYNDGYGFIVQDTRINRIIEIECPFYQCGTLGLLQNPNVGDDLESYHFSLGNLYIAFSCFDSTEKKKVSFDLYYCLADDHRFSVFQGFPPMMYAPSDLVEDEAFDFLEAQMGLFDKPMQSITNIEQKTTETLESVKVCADKVTSLIDVAIPPKSNESPPEDLMNGFYSWLTSKVNPSFKHCAVSAVSQLVHCIINPTIKTAAWAFTSFLITLGLLCQSVAETFTSCFTKLLNWVQNIKDHANFTHKESDQSNETKPLIGSDTLEPQMSGNEIPLDVKAGLSSTIVTSILALFGVKKKIKNIPDFFDSVYSGMHKYTLTANGLCLFFKNNLEWMIKLYKWCAGKIFPDRKIAIAIADCKDDIKDLVEEILVLCDESNARKIEVEPRWNLRVYTAAAKASIYLAKLSSSHDKPSSPVLNHLLRQILEKRDSLVRFQISPPIRFEPFVVYFYGSSNVGKSHICQNIGKDLLESINYKSREELIYTRTPGNAYWNGLRCQPICLYDDFLCIGGENGLQQVGELFCLKSRAIFNPPQAEIKDKMIRYNPLLVFLASNQDYPRIPGVECIEALYRRRDILVKAEPDFKFYKEHGVDPVHGSPNDFKKEDIKEYQHLFFYVAEQPKNPDTRWAGPYTYGILKDVIQLKFSKHYENEFENYEQSLKDCERFFPDDEDEWDVNKQLLAHNNKINSVNVSRMKSVSDTANICANLLLKYDNRQQTLPIIKILISQLAKINIDATWDLVLLAPHLFQTVVNSEPGRLRYFTKEEVKNFFKLLDEQVNMEPQMAGNPFECPHQDFNNNCEYVPEQKSFYDVDTDLYIPETPCDAEDCPWKNTEVLMEKIKVWYTWPNCPQRQSLLFSPDKLPLPLKQFLLSKRLIRERVAVSSQTKFTKVCLELKKIKEWVVKSLKSIGGGILDLLMWGASICAGLAVISAFVWTGSVCYEGYKQLKEDPKAYLRDEITIRMIDDATKPQMMASGDYKVAGKVKPKDARTVAIKMISDNISANMSIEKEHVLFKQIQRNTIYIAVDYGSAKYLEARLLGLMSSYALGCTHYDDKFRHIYNEFSDAKFYIKGNNFSIPIDYLSLQFRPFKDSALCLYTLPKQFPFFKNILKHIAKQKDHSSIGPKTKLVECDLNKQIFCRDQIASRIYEQHVPEGNGFKSFTVIDGYRYNHGGKGVCGSVLVSDHNDRPIMGMHVAGSSSGSIGVSEALAVEMFDFLLTVDEPDIFEPNMLEFVENAFEVKTDVMQLGQVPPLLAHRESMKSRIIPTECHGKIFPVYCEPPILHPDDERNVLHFSPMLEGVNKHGIVTKNFPDEIVKNSVEDLKNKILAYTLPCRSIVGKLSKRVAIVGDPALQNYDKLDFNTSEGFPFVALRPKNVKSKIWMLTMHQDDQNNYILDDIDESLKEVIKVKKQQRLDNIIPFTVFTDCLKDHKLPIDKVRQPGKVRIFSISPLDFTIQCRQYFLDFTVAYQAARLNVEHAVGINVDSMEWSDIYFRLKNINTKIVTADYSGFGPSLNALVAMECFDIIQAWYEHNGDTCKKNKQMRKIIMYELVYSVHLVFNSVYRTFCGLPSGNPLTVILNSLVNCIYVRNAWQLIFSYNLEFSRINEVSLSAFNKHVVFFVYGDDLIMAVSDLYLELYNCISISDCLNKYNIIVKNATKGDDVVKYNHILDNDTTFLKRNFKPHPFRQFTFLAALDYKSVEDTVNWTYKEWANQLHDMSLEACDQSARLAFGHGPLYHKHIVSSIVKFWLMKHEHISLPTWHDLDSHFFASV